MSVQQLDDIHSPGMDVLGTTQDAGTGAVIAQTGDVVAEEPGSDGAEWWQHVGFASRPAKARKAQDAAQAVTLNRGDRDIVVASRDLRVTVPPLAEGEAVLFAVGADLTVKASIVLKQDGTINITSASKVVVHASEVDLASASDFAALSQKVDSNFSALSTAIQVSTCPGGTGGPLVFAPPSLPSVAASAVKIS